MSLIEGCIRCGRRTLGGYPDGVCPLCEIQAIEDKEFVKHVQWALETIHGETLAKGLGLSGESETRYGKQ